jgi:hypothetical protein
MEDTKVQGVRRTADPLGSEPDQPQQDLGSAETSTVPDRVVFASPFHTTDPARFLYEAFAEAKDWRDAHGPMKKWEALSIHDRRAWASVNEHMFSASGHISIRLPPEDGETVHILRRRGQVFAMSEVSLEALAKIADVRRVLASLDEELRRLSKEYAEAQTRKWHIDEPKKFEAPG